MRVLNAEKRIDVFRHLVDGNSFRSIVRLTVVALNTVTNLLRDTGTACAVFQRERIRNPDSERIQCDEIWCYCRCKQKNVRPDREGILGIRRCLDPGCLGCGSQDRPISARRPTGHRPRHHVHTGLGIPAQPADPVDHRRLRPVSRGRVVGVPPQRRFRHAGQAVWPGAGRGGSLQPAPCIGAVTRVIRGNPDPTHISTSYSERQNLTMRMNMRRFTRLTNAFSKRIDNLEAAIALYFFHYNFIRRHQTLRITPAMAAGVTNRLWLFEDILRIL